MSLLEVRHGRRGIPSNLSDQGFHFKLWADLELSASNERVLEQQAKSMWGVTCARVINRDGVTSLLYSIAWWHGWRRQHIADRLMCELAAMAHSCNTKLTEFSLSFERYNCLTIPQRQERLYIWAGRIKPVRALWTCPGAPPRVG